ncbi:hypothetical protein AB1N83_000094 [Pleurotus pulmonarius]
MSLRIKISAKASDRGSNEADELARRKATKRRIVDSDDDEHSPATVSSTLSGNSRPKRVRRPSQRVLDGMDSSDADVDVEGDHTEDSRFLASTSHDTASSSRATTKPSKKRRAVKVAVSDDEDDDFAAAQGPDDDPLPSDSEEADFTYDADEPKWPKKGKASSKRSSAKAPTTRRSKGKPAKVVEKPIPMKDERRSHLKESTPASESTSGVKRARPKDAELDVDGFEPSAMEASNSMGASSQTDGSATAGENATSSGPNTPSIASASAPKAIAGLATKQGAGDPKAANLPRPAAYVGMTDFDLRNPNVYSELFKTASGNTPRSGLNRREKEEERLKELDKMRDEARTKRMAEAKPPFDLQAQVEKIYNFEQRLVNRSSALYPNCLGARWRDDWELKRKREQRVEANI